MQQACGPLAQESILGRRLTATQLPGISDNRMNPDFCTIGIIVRPRGIKGELKVMPLTDFPERFISLREVFLEPPDEPIRKVIQNVWQHKNAFIVRFEGIDSISAAEPLVMKYIRIPVEKLRPLEKGQYYWHDLTGLDVIDDEYGALGKVERVFRAGKSGNDVLVVIGDSVERLIPMIDDVVLDVDLERGTMRVRLPEEIYNA